MISSDVKKFWPQKIRHLEMRKRENLCQSHLTLTWIFKPISWCGMNFFSPIFESEFEYETTWNDEFVEALPIHMMNNKVLTLTWEKGIKNLQNYNRSERIEVKCGIDKDRDLKWKRFLRFSQRNFNGWN